MAEVGRVFVTVVPSARGFAGKLTSQVGPDVDRAGRTSGNRFGRGFVTTAAAPVRGFGKIIGAAAAGLAGAKIAGFFADSVRQASDLAESGNKVRTVFGRATPAILRFATRGADRLGQTKLAVLDAASTFGVFGKAAGLSGRDLAKFSTGFVGLSTDLASFYNTSPEQAIEAIGAALRGEAEPIRQYGVLLDDATLRQEALKLGLIDTTKKALTPQQKVLAAQAAIYRQTRDAQGDFARTSGDLANQQRTLGARFNDIKATIGGQLLPVVNSAAGAANRFFRELQNGTGTGGKVAAFVTGAAAGVRAFIADFRAGEGAAGRLRDVLETVGAAILSVSEAAGGGNAGTGFVRLAAGALTTVAALKAITAAVTGAKAAISGVKAAAKAFSTTKTAVQDAAFAVRYYGTLSKAAFGAKLSQGASAAASGFRSIGAGARTAGTALVGYARSAGAAAAAGARFAVASAAAGLRAVASGAQAAGVALAGYARAALAAAVSGARTAAAAIATRVAMAGTAIATAAATVATKAFAVAQGILNVVLRANPIILLVTLVGLLIGSLIAAYRSSSRFRAGVQAAWTGIKTVTVAVFTAVAAFVRSAWLKISTAIRIAVTIIRTIIGTYFRVYRAIIVGVLSAIRSVVSRVWSGIRATITTVAAGIRAVITAYFRGYRAVITAVMSAIRAVISKVWSGIRAFIAAQVAAIRAVIGGIRAVIGIVTATFGRVAAVIRDKISDAVATVRELPGKIRAAFSGAGSWLLGVGGDIIDGLIAGIRSAAGRAASAAADVASSAVSAVKSRLKIFSPSRVMRDEVGRFIPQGIAAGIRADGSVAAAMRQVAETVTGPLTRPGVDLRSSGITGAAGVTGQGLVHIEHMHVRDEEEAARRTAARFRDALVLTSLTGQVV
ncbi:MAG: phage tail protein [Phycicoccus sp.]